MATTPVGFYRGTLTTTSTPLATVSTGTGAVVTNIVVCNKTATASTVTLALDGVYLMSAATVAAATTVVVDIRQATATTGTKVITGSAGAATTIDCHISGVTFQMPIEFWPQANVEARRQTPTGLAMNVQIGPGDSISNIPVVMDYEHHQVHEGETYKAIDSQNIGTSTYKYAFVVGTYSPAVWGPHLLVECDVYNGSARIDIYAEATYTGTTAMTGYNRNRNLGTYSGASALYKGVTSTDGALIDSFYAAAGKFTAAGGRSASEWVLKSGATYRIDLVGLVVNTQAIVSFNWYEDLGV